MSVSYLAMNLFPTNARRVFPCIDEPTETSIISFTINEAPYANIISNTQLEAADSVSFKSMAGAPFRWALFGHDFTTYNVPVTNIVQLAGRPGLAGQENQASVAINSIYGTLNEWTNKPYLEIVNNQADNMHILAIPDVDIEWNTLSVIGLWNKYWLSFGDLIGTRDFVFNLREAPIDRGALGTCSKCPLGKGLGKSMVHPNSKIDCERLVPQLGRIPVSQSTRTLSPLEKEQ
ncbi:hypothetical protein evm_014997 [Chilo suppressalis]|nr:hypothetical protein evm_014997 [Chilo suppressalis]